MSHVARCTRCRDAAPLALPFTMAFQPIIDVRAGTIWGYEALVRGLDGAPASSILERIRPDDTYAFDQACRVKAIELMGRLDPGGTARLSINFMPNAVYEPRACIRATLEAASRVGLDPARLMFEFTENERMADPTHVERIVREYRRMGFTTALDDFGAGHAGLGLLARFLPDLIKIDMLLVRGVDASRERQVIVSGIVRIARDLGVEVLAEGVEMRAEAQALAAMGITLMQGYAFAKPALEALPTAEFPLVRHEDETAAAWDGHRHPRPPRARSLRECTSPASADGDEPRVGPRRNPAHGLPSRNGGAASPRRAEQRAGPPPPDGERDRDAAPPALVDSGVVDARAAVRAVLAHGRGKPSDPT